MEKFIRTHAGSMIVGIALIVVSLVFGVQLYQTRSILALVQEEQARRSGLLLPLPKEVQENQEHLLKLEGKLDALLLPCMSE